MSAAGAPDAAKGQAKKSKKSKKTKKGGGGDVKARMATQLPVYIEHRVACWEKFKARRAAEAMPEAERPVVRVELPDGKVVEGKQGVITPLDIAQDISRQFAKQCIVAKVDGEMHDLHRPIMADCKLELCKFDSKEGKHAFWHSSAHVLGQALEAQFGGNLCIGPPIESGGFYYDIFMGADRDKDAAQAKENHRAQAVTPEDYEVLKAWIKKMTSAKHPFERLVLTKDEALEMFKFNKFKLDIVGRKVPDGETCTAYRSGPLIDLCKGPHVLHTGIVKCLEIVKSSSAYWLGNADNESLQRVYGISFPDNKMLKAWVANMELAAQRDHRRIGQEQKLFFFSQLSPGSAFFLPHGQRIYNTLIEFIKSEYRRRGFQEVGSPNVYNLDLWRISGHYDNYAENMFQFECEKQKFGIKPMNCPGHCLMFRHETRSFRDLPLRLADFGVLHRNELSGALTGLTRVRRFQQDDAHIFCRMDQIEEEIRGALDFMSAVYSKFGFTYHLALSTRPEKFLGEIATWDEAEKALARCLEGFMPGKWNYNHGDGAFYGPKIDIEVCDAMQRKFQCATIQLDFQLPRRFGLFYKKQGEDGEEDGDDEQDKEKAAQEEGEGEEKKKEDGGSKEFKSQLLHVEKSRRGCAQPVMIHRAILGSVERMIAILCEHTGGLWPFWLSPRQAQVVPVTLASIPYARQVREALWGEGFFCDVDETRDQLKKKIRNAEVERYNFILVVGVDEEQAGTVNLRERLTPNQKTRIVSLGKLVQEFKELKRAFK